MVNGVPWEVPWPKTLGACGPSGFGLGTSLGILFTTLHSRLFHTLSQYTHIGAYWTFFETFRQFKTILNYFSPFEFFGTILVETVIFFRFCFSNKLFDQKSPAFFVPVTNGEDRHTDDRQTVQPIHSIDLGAKL